MGFAMRELGWERKQRRVPNEPNPKWCYVKGTDAEQERYIAVLREITNNPRVTSIKYWAQPKRGSATHDPDQGGFDQGQEAEGESPL